MSDRPEPPGKHTVSSRAEPRPGMQGAIAAGLVILTALALGIGTLPWLVPTAAGALAYLDLRKRFHVQRPALTAAAIAAAFAVLAYLILLAIALASLSDGLTQMA